MCEIVLDAVGSHLVVPISITNGALPVNNRFCVRSTWKNISSNIKQLPEESPMRKQAEKAMDELVNKFNEEIKYIDANHNKRR